MDETPTGRASEQKARLLNFTKQGVREATGSGSHEVQREFLEQVQAVLWSPEWRSKDKQERSMQAAYEALRKIAPRSELEGMLAVQMIGTHNAAIECLHRAKMEGHASKARDFYFKHAVKLMALYERQLAALDKHRGKGQQKITVEHVNVHAGGQAIVGDVRTGEAAQRSAPPVAKQHAALGDESMQVPSGTKLKKTKSFEAPLYPPKSAK